MGQIVLDKLIASFGVGSHISKEDNKRYFHIFIVGNNCIKIFFTEDEEWTEDINKRAETDDVTFANEALCVLFETEDKRNKIEANLLF